MYPIKEVPQEAEPLTDWLYKRFEEKEALLAHFYRTGGSRKEVEEGGGAARCQIVACNWLNGQLAAGGP